MRSPAFFRGLRFGSFGRGLFVILGSLAFACSPAGPAVVPGEKCTPALSASGVAAAPTATSAAAAVVLPDLSTAPVPPDRKDERCEEPRHWNFGCSAEPSCRPVRGKTPHERDCWAIGQAICGSEDNVLENIDNSCALRSWAMALDDCGDLNDRALQSKVLETPAIRDAVRVYAKAQHEVAEAARILADALERREAAVYWTARLSTEVAVERSLVANRRYGTLCEDVHW